jgi:hypothetical protein
MTRFQFQPFCSFLPPNSVGSSGRRFEKIRDRHHRHISTRHKSTSSRHQLVASCKCRSHKQHARLLSGRTHTHTKIGSARGYRLFSSSPLLLVQSRPVLHPHSSFNLYPTVACHRVAVVNFYLRFAPSFRLLLFHSAPQRHSPLPDLFRRLHSQHNSSLSCSLSLSLGRLPPSLVQLVFCTCSGCAALRLGTTAIGQCKSPQTSSCTRSCYSNQSLDSCVYQARSTCLALPHFLFSQSLSLSLSNRPNTLFVNNI